MRILVVIVYDMKSPPPYHIQGQLYYHKIMIIVENF